MARLLPWVVGLLVAGCADSTDPERTADDPRAPAEAGAAPADARSADTSANPQPADATTTPSVDAAPPPSAGNPYDGELSPLKRGEYLVLHAAACTECHTPRLISGMPDPSRLLAGNVDIFDVVPDDDARGMLHAPNLTPDDETGLGRWSDREIKDAFQRGVSRDGRVLDAMMPHWIYHNMTDDDADAIVEFLRSVPPVSHAVPERQPLAVDRIQPAEFLPVDALPDTSLTPDHPDYGRAQRGRYMATAVGLCVYCHTEEAPAGDVYAIRLDRILMGHREWYPIELGFQPVPGTPTILSRNLTPAPDGIVDYSAEQIARAIKTGNNYANVSLCRPMPFGDFGAHGMMTTRDATDIGYYLTTLTPRDNEPVEACCEVCHQAMQEAGTTFGPLPPGTCPGTN